MRAESRRRLTSWFDREESLPQRHAASDFDEKDSSLLSRSRRLRSSSRRRARPSGESFGRSADQGKPHRGGGRNRPRRSRVRAQSLRTDSKSKSKSRDLKELEAGIEAQAEVIMLDNFSVEDAKRAVKFVDGMFAPGCARPARHRNFRRAFREKTSENTRFAASMFFQSDR